MNNEPLDHDQQLDSLAEEAEDDYNEEDDEHLWDDE